MIRLIAILSLTVAAQELVDFGVITETEGLEIHRCHTNDTVKIEVLHLSKRTNSLHGWFFTEQPALYLSDLSMIPNGTNIFRVQTLCSGSTSEVSEVRFVIRRPIPKPVFEKAEKFQPAPPMPPGFTDVPRALPGGTNSDYSQVRWYRSENRRGK